MFKYVTRLILLFCLCAITHAQVVDIPDPNLRAAIRDTLNLPGDEPITKARCNICQCLLQTRAE